MEERAQVLRCSVGDCARDEWAPGSKEAKDAGTVQTLSLAPAPPAAAAILAPKKDALCLEVQKSGVGITTKIEREE